MIWAFTVDSADAQSFSTLRPVAGLFAVAALTCDLLHYVVAIVVWGGSYAKDREGFAEALSSTLRRG